VTKREVRDRDDSTASEGADLKFGSWTGDLGHEQPHIRTDRICRSKLSREPFIRNVMRRSLVLLYFSWLPDRYRVLPAVI
jgi:hypothetical protein